MQFVPKFLAQAKTRIEELGKDRDAMPKVLSNDGEMWGELHVLTSAIKEKLKDMLKGGSDCVFTGKDTSSIDITPHVTEMYRRYAAGVRKVRGAVIFREKV